MTLSHSTRNVYHVRTGLRERDVNTIEFGDCRETMRRWASHGIKAQMCVTSPPYFGLRDYGHDGQIGLEETPDAYIAAMVEVFRCVRDVLSDDGTVWLNIGDSYANDGKWGGSSGGKHAKALHGNTSIGRTKVTTGLKPKDLIGIPWMLAFALRADGWYLRQDIIWHKPNPMPESVRDRCTKSHEYVFLLSKSERYHYDADAISEPFADSSLERLRQDIASQRGRDRVPGKTNGPMKAVGNINAGRSSYKAGSASSMNDGEHVRKSDAGLPVREAGRNKRSVWTVTTRPYKGAHFATFPPALIEPCILAGSRPGDVVLDPFMGSGTTAAVAIQHGRQYLGCELNADYGPLQDERIAEARRVAAERAFADRQLDLLPALSHPA